MLFGWRQKKVTLPTASEALPGRDASMPVAERHVVLNTPLRGPWPGAEEVQLAMGCFWGAERKLWRTPGVVCTSVGYAGGFTKNPTYDEVCSGQTGHTEVVHVAYDPAKISFPALLAVFFEGHDPTQGMRQGNDVGTQYRSAIYVDGAERLAQAVAVRNAYQERLTAAGFGEITTEIRSDVPYYFAEDFHQQYLSDAKNPDGYCGIGGTGVGCPVGVGA